MPISDEDTRPECRNVGPWTVAFWSYVHLIFIYKPCRVAFEYVRCYLELLFSCILLKYSVISVKISYIYDLYKLGSAHNILQPRELCPGWSTIWSTAERPILFLLYICYTLSSNFLVVLLTQYIWNEILSEYSFFSSVRNDRHSKLSAWVSLQREEACRSVSTASQFMDARMCSITLGHISGKSRLLVVICEATWSRI